MDVAVVAGNRSRRRLPSSGKEPPNRGRNNTPSSRRWRLLPFRTAVMPPMTQPSGSIHPIPHAARSLERTSWAESQSMTGLAPSFSTATKTQHITTSIFAPTSRSATGTLTDPVGTIRADYEPYGLCMYRSQESGRFYVFVTGRNLVGETDRRGEGPQLRRRLAERGLRC